MSTNAEAALPPGFRFHPTDEELILHYLRNRIASLPCPADIIAEVDIYKFNPWDLPAKTQFGDKEWYFFTPRDRKYPNGIRPNRAAASGYWKATGTDKPIVTSTGAGAGRVNIGVKKALVFYKGKPPKGRKTSWIMHEYRLADRYLGNRSPSVHFCRRPVQNKDSSSMRLDDWVLCRIYKKPTGMQRTLLTADQDQQQREDEEEEGGGECGNINGEFPCTMTTSNNSISKQGSSRLFKTPSLSELFQNDMFSHLLSEVNPPAEPAAAAGGGGFERDSRSGQHAYDNPGHAPHVGYGSGTVLDRNGIINLPVMEQYTMPYQRESNNMSMASRQEDDAALLLNQSKDCGPTAFNPQIFNNLKQPYINHGQQNLLWNPNFGLH